MGEGSGLAVSCGVGCRLGLDLALLCLWCTPAAVALIQPLAWELAYATAAATQDLSRGFDLYHSSQQRRILNPLSKDRDRTRNLMVPSWSH